MSNEEKWTYHFVLKEIDNTLYNQYELEINNLDIVFKNLEDNFITESSKHQSHFTQSYDEELKTLIEGNKELRHEMDMKLKEISSQQVQYETYKKDQKLLAQEIKETHEAFLMAKKCYKKFLKIYYTIESQNKDTQNVYVQFFTESKKDTERYSVHLLRNIKNRSYELCDVNPKLKMFKDLQRKLQDTNDVPGALCCIRQAFMAIREKKIKNKS